MTDINTLERSVRILTIDADYLGKQLDAAIERGDDLSARSIERTLSVKENLLFEAQDKLDHARSEAGRRSAEARLAFHADEDTLDQY